MNNSYLSNGYNPSTNFNTPPMSGGNVNVNGEEYIPNEQSYIENILRVNKGKKVSIYQSFADAQNWRDKVFTGIIEQSGRDHIILSDPITGKWYLLLMIYVNYIEFDEPINTVDQFYPQNPQNY